MLLLFPRLLSQHFSAAGVIDAGDAWHIYDKQLSVPGGVLCDAHKLYLLAFQTNFSLPQESLLQALHGLTDKQLPVPGGVLWNAHVLPARRAGLHLDLKASSHKKLSKLLQVRICFQMYSTKCLHVLPARRARVHLDLRANSQRALSKLAAGEDVFIDKNSVVNKSFSRAVGVARRACALDIKASSHKKLSRLLQAGFQDLLNSPHWRRARRCKSNCLLACCQAPLSARDLLCACAGRAAGYATCQRINRRSQQLPPLRLQLRHPLTLLPTAAAAGPRPGGHQAADTARGQGVWGSCAHRARPASPNVPRAQSVGA